MGDSILFNKKWVEVKGYKKVLAQGLYAPLTLSGTLLVNGILVSNYANIQDHNLVHNAFFPLRALHGVFGAFLTNNYINGINWYASFLMFISERLGVPSLDYTFYNP